MSIKDKLETHRKLLCKIQASEQQLRNLQERMVLPSTSDPSRTRVQGGDKGNYLPSALYQVDVIQRELEGLYVLRDQEHGELWQTVNLLGCSEESIVLQSKYFSLMNRENIAKLLFGHEEDFRQSRQRYLNRTSKLHSSAISKLNRKLAA